MPQTKRDRIIAAIQQQYLTAPEMDGIQFGQVERGPLSDLDHRKRVVLGLVVGQERKKDLYPYKECRLTLNVEFRVTLNRGDPGPTSMAEQVMGQVQQVLYNDKTAGGLTISIDEKGSEIDLFTYSDKSIQGVVVFEVLYRHAQDSVYD